MKPAIILFSIFSLLTGGVAAQNTCLTETFSGSTAGWSYSQGAHIGKYDNPTSGCSEDRGIITPGVGGNNPSNIRTGTFTSTGAPHIDLNFDIIVLDANLKCNTWKDYACQTSVDVFYYVAGTKFTAIIDQVLPPNGPNNSTLVSFSFDPGNNLPAGTVYAIEFCFKPKSGVGQCIQQNTKYVFDNFELCEINQRSSERQANVLNNQQGTAGAAAATPATKNEFTVTPTRTKKTGKITATGGAGVRSISLMDNSGKVVQTALNVAFFVFNIQGMNPGKYFVQFEMENGDQLRKPVTIE